MWLTFEHVTKFYGPVIGVNDITCRIGPGITGLLGANGAGKSTLMKLASGQLRPNGGEVRIGDHRAWSAAAKASIGFSPDINTFYEEMTGREFVTSMARLSGYPLREARERAELALAEVGMVDRGDRRIGGCSHGMRQRIKLAQSLVHDPPILLLDEPMTGIDPGGRRDLSRLLVALAERGKTILVSSHLLVEVEQLTDSMLMIARGRIVASGTLAEVRGLIDDQPFAVRIVARPVRRLAAQLAELPEVLSLDLQDDVLTVRTLMPARFYAALGELALADEFEVERFETLDVGADAVFNYLQQDVG
ncbi:MAG: ABC transporter ATP-binding protein [Pirellulales bacterium]|nr:ABC transporter ATP-binding protein [Pirellulales bacterium]